MKSPRVIIKTARYFIDVFHGEYGFELEEWSRFVIINKRFLKLISGSRLSSVDYQLVCKKLGV